MLKAMPGKSVCAVEALHVRDGAQDRVIVWTHVVQTCPGFAAEARTREAGHAVRRERADARYAGPINVRVVAGVTVLCSRHQDARTFPSEVPTHGQVDDQRNLGNLLEWFGNKELPSVRSDGHVHACHLANQAGPWSSRVDHDWSFNSTLVCFDRADPPAMHVDARN